MFACPIFLESLHPSLVVQHQFFLLELSDGLFEFDVFVSHSVKLLLEAVDLVPVLSGDLLQVAVLLVIKFGHGFLVAALEDLVLGAQRLKLISLLLEAGFEVLDVFALVLEIFGFEVGLSA